MANLDLPAARAIIAGATPGEWVARHDQDCDGYCYIERVDDRDPVGDSYHWHDATFIAAAREGWPAALDECERLEMELRCAQIQVEDRGNSYAEAKADLDTARAEVATIRAALVEACDLAEHGYNYSEGLKDDPEAMEDITRLRALAAGGAG